MENDLYYELSIPRPNITNEFSISIWIKQNNIGKTTLFDLTNDIHLSGKAKNIKLFTKCIDEQTTFSGQLYNEEFYQSFTADLSGEILPIHNFHNIIATYSRKSESFNVYINNKKVFEFTDIKVMPNVNDLIKFEDIASETAITIHSYMIFNKTILQEDEIETIYNNGVPPSYYTH